MKKTKEKLVKKMLKYVNDDDSFYLLLYRYLNNRYDLKYLFSFSELYSSMYKAFINNHRIREQLCHYTVYDLDVFKTNNMIVVLEYYVYYSSNPSSLVDIIKRFKLSNFNFKGKVYRDTINDRDFYDRGFSILQLLDIYFCTKDEDILKFLVSSEKYDILELCEYKDKLPAKYSKKILERLYNSDFSIDDISKEDLRWLINKIKERKDFTKAVDLFLELDDCPELKEIFEFILKEDQGKYTYYLLDGCPLSQEEDKKLNEKMKKCTDPKYKFLYMYNYEQNKLKKIFPTAIEMEAFLRKYFIVDFVKLAVHEQYDVDEEYDYKFMSMIKSVKEQANEESKKYIDKFKEIFPTAIEMEAFLNTYVNKDEHWELFSDVEEQANQELKKYEDSLKKEITLDSQKKSKQRK
ncbi:MAG: hypothetical protein IJ094_03955 [Bacilli bacterium]|nr:hypothetical protein [Bacilli bacterium]